MEKKRTTGKKHKLDIFKVIDRINAKDRFYYRELSEEDQKEIPFVPLVRWLSGSTSTTQIERVNKILNPVVFSFSAQKKHPELMWFLLTICATGTRFNWIKKKPKQTMTLPIQIIRETYGYDDIDANDALSVLSNDDIIELAQDLGKEDKILRDLKKELKKR